MPKKVFTGTVTTTYPEFLTSQGSLIGIPGEVRDLPSFPDDGNWADVPPEKAAKPEAKAAAPAPAAKAAARDADAGTGTDTVKEG
jgi:hypothetical protein